MNYPPLNALPSVRHKSGWPWQHTVATSLLEVAHVPKISIITPSYNQGQYLEETIRSIIMQDYPNYELIIIDAGSTDETLEVIKKYGPWIAYWVSEKDRGQSHAIQKGLDLATGDIINWINSDDLVAPGAFHHIAATFNLTRYDVLCGKCDYFLNDLGTLELRGLRMGLGATVGDTFIAHKINQPSTFFKASVIKNLGIDEQFRYTMDVDLWFRYLLQAGQSRILLSDGLLTYFRLHDASKSVAEIDYFQGDVWKVHYNILFSTVKIAELLEFAAHRIPNFKFFLPTQYDVQIETIEINSFIQHVAWMAVHEYNATGDYAAARACIAIARRFGQPLNGTMLRQLFKHYVLPASIARWLAANSLT
jgi:glycosyltransferase involved in cell wall biosynthesis